MVYTSFNFLLFFPALFVLYYLTPVRFRWLTLLVASYFFYINLKPVYVLLLAGVTTSTYVFTYLIDKAEKESGKKTFMILNIILILSPLFFFKYFNMFNQAIYGILETMNIRWPLPDISLVLPIGISFYTFMAIGYTIDVYNGEIEVEKNIGIVALFVSFFPLILSGPIERAKNMLPQFREQKTLDYSMIREGLKIMLWGYFMKLVVADRIGIYVDAVYSNIPRHNGTSLLFASMLYPFQLYADLGGYSLIAIGAARILGFKVMDNFKRPFCATSMAEFWRRWHISLISWLTDYIYTPLSFTLRKYHIWGIIIALLFTFLLSGVWHGAALSFFIWGLMQGIFLSIEALLNKKKTKIEKKFGLSGKAWYVIAGICLTYFLFTVSIIFSRAADLNDGLLVYKRIFSTTGSLFIGSPATLIYGMLGLSMLLVKDFTEEFAPSALRLFENRRRSVRVLSYSSVIIIILLIGVLDGGQFIYFQF